MNVDEDLDQNLDLLIVGYISMGVYKRDFAINTKILCDGPFSNCFAKQGFSFASAIGHSPKIVPDVREFAVQFLEMHAVRLCTVMQ